MRLSASGVPRALKCAASVVLPHQDYVTDAALAGVDRHADLEAAADLGLTDGVHPDIVALYPPNAKMTTEAAFAYDVATDTARALGHGRSAYVDLAPFEIPGTADLIVYAHPRALVVDHKSYEEADPAQITTYALMFARSAGIDEVTVAYNYKLRRPWIATLGPLELDAHAAKLRQLAKDVADRPTVNPGTWCKYCAAYLTCPANAALVRSVSSGITAVQIEGIIPLASDEDAARAYELSKTVGTLQQRLTAALIARAKERPIPLPDGQVFGEHEKLGPTVVDADVAYAAIRESYGQAKADAAMTRKATQASIERALGKDGKKAVLKVIQERNGLSRETKRVISLHAPAEPSEGR
jgi:hypothetical protein